jgi:uncharacterized phage protein (TIGR01671 family)
MNSPLYRIWDKSIREYIEKEYSASWVGNVQLLWYTGGNFEYDVYVDQSVYIIERCSGLKDINGNWIYAGDIVQYSITTHCSETEAEQYIKVVMFKDGQFYPRPVTFDCEDKYYSYELDNIKVIGNIHENPELIKETEDV